MAKQRWIKVSISYHEGQQTNQWDAVTLGETSMVEVVEATTFASEVNTLADVVGMAATELVRRSERVMPPKATDDEQAVPA